MPEKHDLASFVEKAIKIHFDKYSYESVDYVNVLTKVKITCKYHHGGPIVFLQRPKIHLAGGGCIHCSKVNISKKLTGSKKSVKVDERATLSKDNFVKEARAQKSIQNYLSSDHYKFTPEFCLADGVFCFEGGMFMPIQVKSASKNRNRYVFQHTNKYPNMLLICVSIDAVSFKYLIFSGETLPSSIGYTANGKWEGNRIEGYQLKQTITDIYKAVQKMESDYRLPNGATLDISSIIQGPITDFSMPSESHQALAQSQANLREERFRGLTFEYPAVQHTSVDVIINDLRFQDKCAHGENKGTCLAVALNKSRRLSNDARKKVSYDIDDFDALWIHVPNTDFFYIIPMQTLIQHGLINSSTSKGVKGFCFSKAESHWTNRHKIFMNTNTELIITQMLESIKKSVP